MDDAVVKNDELLIQMSEDGLLARCVPCGMDVPPHVTHRCERMRFAWAPTLTASEWLIADIGDETYHPLTEDACLIAV